MQSAMYAECHKLSLHAEYHYAECHYAECRGALYVTLSINDNQRNDFHQNSIVCRYAECHYAECRYAIGKNL